MAWDDMDMWWMNEPRKSNLPELAVGAFMQGRAQAQRQAEFAAELPMRVAESNARTAAQVAQMNIATKRFEHEASQWEKEANQAQPLQDYTQEIAAWYSDPLNKNQVPTPKPGLFTGENLAKVNKLMLDASIAKRVQVAQSEVGMARAKDMEDTANLIASGFLDETKAQDTEAKKLARMNRAGREAETLAMQMGIRNMPLTDVPTLPNGDLDKTKWQYTLQQFKPSVAIPAGMVAETLTITDANGNKVTYKTPEPQKAKETKEEYIRRVSADALAKGLPAETAAQEAARVWDLSTGKTPAAPSGPVAINQKNAAELIANSPVGTIFEAEEDIVFPDGGKLKKGTTRKKLSPEEMDSRKASAIEKRKQEIKVEIDKLNAPIPSTEKVGAFELWKEMFESPDRIRESTFLAPKGSDAMRTRKKSPEDALRLKKLMDEFSELEAQGKSSK